MKKSDTEPNKLQIQGSVKILVTPNDKLTQKLFQRPADKYAKMILSGKSATINEEFTDKKKKVVSHTEYWVELVGSFADLTPLDGYDRATLDVCISAQDAGLSGITVNEIARLMAGGKSNNQMTRVRAEQKARILRSLRKLMSTRITVDFSELTTFYPKLPNSGRLMSTILPCDIGEGLTVNGQRGVDVVIFRGESVLLTLARAKNQQLLSYPVALLDVPNQNNSPLVTKVKFYVTRWVQAVKTHKELKPTIVLETLYKNCGLIDADNGRKRDARKFARDVFENLKAQGVILEYEFEKIGGRYRAIKFRY